MENSYKLDNVDFELEQQLLQIDSLPPFPLLASILRAFLQADDNGDIRSLVTNIEQEPSVMAKVLSVSNSAYYASDAPVKSVRDCVNRLGITRLKSVVFSLIVSNKFDTKKCPAFNMSLFWYDSMVLAHTAAHIIDQLKPHLRLNRNEVYCIGLLLNIGLLFLVNASPNKMDQIFEPAVDDDISSLIKKQFNNMDQYSIGSQLLDHWSLPEEFIYTLGQINNPGYEGNCSEIIWVILLGKAMIMNDFSAIDSKNQYAAKLSLSDANCESILVNCKNDLEWIKAFADNF